MSFFGFDTSLPRDRGHQSTAPGFGQTHDPFAGLSQRNVSANDEVLDFEETYDGLGDQLDETDDAFNDDTFGGEPANQQSVGKDFDFSGQTAQIADTMKEEQMLYAARQPPQRQPSPPKKSTRPARTGYEKYSEPTYIPELQANASLWGMAPRQPSQDVTESYHRKHSEAVPPTSNRKMMSLEEVEAMMRAQNNLKSTTPQPAPQTSQPQPRVEQAQLPIIPPQQGPHPQGQFPNFSGPPQILQRPQQLSEQRFQQGARPPPQGDKQNQGVQHAQVFQRQRQAPMELVAHRSQHTSTPPGPRRTPQPRQILQNPNRLSGHGQPIAPSLSRPSHQAHLTGPMHARGPSYPGAVVTNPQQLLNLSDEDRAAFLAEDARRAKRNHKIHMLSLGNGLMTPQDKNFITRIQLQQLVTATGGVDDQDPEAALTEDFYYQVYSQIRGAARENPNQPANHFAQTYLFQTGGRYGLAGRRHPRGGDNHMQRMEQQVQRAVEAAKAKPKNKQLVIEGSLGKISFSNAKTPKPLLNLKRTDSADVRPSSAGRRPSRHAAVLDRKATLRDIENVYSDLMAMEDHERHLPPPLNENSDPESIQQHMEWRHTIQDLNQKLWRDLKVMEPIVPNSPVPHPFIAILSHPKGKKTVPRVFRHIDEQQRVTILTMIVVHLDTLDVVRNALLHHDEPKLSRMAREEVELFAHSVIPSLFSYINEAPLTIVIGLLGLVLDRTNIQNLVRTKIGLSILTMFVSRAEIFKQSSAPGDLTDSDWEQWLQLYNKLFDIAEPVLPYIFPGSVNDTEDVYVWQYLAAMGVGASPEQQQRLVLGVKDRVMETVNVSKALPPEIAATRLGHVNLFMRAIGLDVELLG
ncbi:hypothetical protein M501DRAFT_1004447 [Patellaria atrata CBS 101060]|uniref:mRNA decay factor PAT1 domain-containing protein n=1 Tax=Patellaria atrata CBS 101060 TaxID=1346257 RepID=A0A9P4VMH5_9PEZI|nr:hypothetical protein M501DRAFT_1004447 [Patellaria atrata CBS 101060]